MFVAECLSRGIFTEGGTWDELRTNVGEAVRVTLSINPSGPLFAWTSFAMKRVVGSIRRTISRKRLQLACIANITAFGTLNAIANAQGVEQETILRSCD